MIKTPYILADTYVTLVVDGQQVTFYDTDVAFEKVIKAIHDSDDATINNLIVNAKTIINYSDGSLRKENGALIYHRGKDYVLPDALTKIIIKHQQNALPFDHFVTFFENILKNPSSDSVMDLYAFLERNDLPITDDGCFLAYKGVTADYRDSYSGKFDNRVGKIVKMPREEVNPDREITCSRGLHVCSRSYLDDWYCCDHIMLVKVNPKDVVSVPIDYHNSKMRVCEYCVLSEVATNTKELDEKKINEQPIYNTEEYFEIEGRTDLDDIASCFNGRESIEKMNRDTFRCVINEMCKDGKISTNYYQLLKKYETYKNIKTILLELV